MLALSCKERMIKQITALILVLAIANPFCCCFAGFASEGSDNNSISHSCCGRVNDLPEKDNDAPSPSEKCPCKKPVVQGAGEDFKLVKLNLISDLYSPQLRSDIDTRVSSEPLIRVGFRLRPPPPKRDLHIVYCSFRI